MAHLKMCQCRSDRLSADYFRSCVQRGPHAALNASNRFSTVRQAVLVPDSVGAAQKLSTVIPRHDCLAVIPRPDCLAATPWQDGPGDWMQLDQGLLSGLPYHSRCPSSMKCSPPPSYPPTLHACVSMGEQ